MPQLVVENKNILLFILSVILFGLFTIVLILENYIMERIILPFLLSIIISLLIFLFINKICKDKFCSKIFLISILLHFIFILFWQVLKYHILGLHIPTLYSFSDFISDRDAGGYHRDGVYIANNFSVATLSYHFKGGLFPKLVAFFYYYFTANPVIVCLFNGLLGSFTSCIIYLLGRCVLNYDLAKIYSLFCVFSTSFIVHTSIMIRDSEIMLLTYLSIYLFYKYYTTKKFIYIPLFAISLFLLYSFRAYAALCLIGAFIFAFILSNLKFTKHKNQFKLNKLTLCFIILSPVLIFALLFILKTLIFSFSLEDLLSLRENGYAGTSSDYPWTFDSLFRIFPLLPFIVGYLCFLFSPFPYEWFALKRIHYIPDTLILYLFIPSFLRNIKDVILNKHFLLSVYLFAMVIQFFIYSIIVASSGNVFRLRGPFIPMIYLIAMYRPDKFLGRILNKIQQWRIV